MINNTIINIPSNFNLCILKKNNIKLLYLYNNEKKIKLLLLNSLKLLKFNNYTNSLIILNKKISYKLKNDLNYFNYFIKSLNFYFFFKIKFKGKGYRIRFYKNNKIIKFYFGKSHITYYILKKIILKKINKYKFIIKSPNIIKLKSISKKLINIRKINFYTLRGLRISRQIIYKRKGKKGSYI